MFIYMKETLSLIEKIVNIPTPSGDREAFLHCVDELKKYLGKGFFYHEIESEGFTSLLFTQQKDLKKFDILLYAHLDVVMPEDGPIAFSSNEDLLHGSGVADMKSYAVALARILKNERFVNLKIGLVLVPDEEIGGANGLKQVLRNGYTADLAIVPDAGMGKSIVVKEKGIFMFKLSVETKGGHGSRPWECENAALKLIETYHKMIRDLQIENEKENDGMTLNLFKIQAGEKINQAPAAAEINLDCRYGETEQKERLLRYLEQLREEKNIEFQEIISGDLFKIKEDNQFLAEFKKVFERHYNQKIPLTWYPAGSDARYLAAVGIPVIMFQARGGGYHSREEWIDWRDLRRFAEGLRKYLQKLDEEYQIYFNKKTSS